QHTSKRGLAHFQGITPHVVAIQLDQVEGVEEYAPVGALVTHEIERGHAAVIASHRFAIDDARARAQASQRLDDQRKAVGEVIAGTAVEPHALTILAGDDAKSIVLNLMQPQAAGRQRVGFGGKARRDEAGWKSTRTGRHDVGINRQRWPRLEGPWGSAVSMPSVGRGRAQIPLRGVPLVCTALLEAWYHVPCTNDPQPEGHMASYIARRKFLATLLGGA